MVRTRTLVWALMAGWLGWLVASPGLGAPPPKAAAKKLVKGSKPARKPPPKSSVVKSGAKSQAKAGTKSSTKSASRRYAGKRRARTPSWRAGQQKPAPERYMEIQRALADKGYMSSPPDGKWDDASTEALRRFQEEQNLKPDGKINSLSLIALGLGPNRKPLSLPARPPAGTKEQPPDDGR